MASRILCPQCETAFAYSPALLGKTVKCRQCQHTFVVDRPPAEAPVAAKTVVPPPLPAKVVTDRDVQRRTRQREAEDRRRDDEPPRTLRRDDGERERPVARRRASGAAPRSSGTGVLIGLIAVCLLGVLGIGAGIAWAVWPSSSQATTPTQAAAAPNTPPVVEEPKKTLDDILNNAPKRPDPRPEIKLDPPVAEKKPDLPGPPPPPIRIERPKRPGPGVPGGIDVKPPVLQPRVAPAFVPVTMLSISPPALAKTIEERRLPDPAEFGVVAGGGKLILLHLPGPKKIGVFDVTTTSIKYLDVTDPKPMIAGGMNHFLVYQPEKNTVERYNTRTLEKEATVPANFPGDVAALGMGSATNGPLVAVLKGPRQTRFGGGTLGFFDPISLKELDYEVGGEENTFGIGLHAKTVTLRVSADGSVVTAGGIGGGPGGEINVIDGGRVTRRFQHGRFTNLLPSADGKTLYGPNGLFTPDGQVIGGGEPPFRPRHEQTNYIPAAHGDFALGLTPQGFADRRPPKGEIFLGREKKALHWMGDMPEAEMNRFGEAKETYEQQFFLIPDAKLLVAIDAQDKARLVLHKVDLDEALAKSDAEYLYVSSRPPTVAVPGETYRYVPVVKAKKSGWKLTVESGPKGMAVGGDGAVTWAVPKDFAQPEVNVILKFATGAKEVFQTVRLAVRKPK